MEPKLAQQIEHKDYLFRIAQANKPVVFKTVDLKTGKIRTKIPVRDDDTNNVCRFEKKLVIEEMPF